VFATFGWSWIKFGFQPICRLPPPPSKLQAGSLPPLLLDLPAGCTGRHVARWQAGRARRHTSATVHAWPIATSCTSSRGRRPLAHAPTAGSPWSSAWLGSGLNLGKKPNNSSNIDLSKSYFLDQTYRKHWDVKIKLTIAPTSRAQLPPSTPRGRRVTSSPEEAAIYPFLGWGSWASGRNAEVGSRQGPSSELAENHCAAPRRGPNPRRRAAQRCERPAAEGIESPGYKSGHRELDPGLARQGTIFSVRLCSLPQLVQFFSAGFGLWVNLKLV
jgi:hypothetical protein